LSNAISDLHNYKESKKQKIEIHTKFFNAEMKVSLGEGGRSTVLSDNIGSGVVMLWPFRLHCVGVWISTGLLCMCSRIRWILYPQNWTDYQIFQIIRHYLYWLKFLQI